MNRDEVQIRGALSIPISELRFVTSRSGGPGGQNVNKVETRVELLFHVDGSHSLGDAEKEILRENLKSKIDSDGYIHVVAQESRSQWQNKQRALEKFAQLLRGALKPKKKRIKTKPSRSATERRIQGKRKRSERKKLRKPRFDHE